MIHKNDRFLSDTQIDNLAEWVKSQAHFYNSLLEAVENSNSHALIEAEKLHDKNAKKPFRQRCTHCAASFPTVRIAVEDPWGSNQTLSCAGCYDEWHPEPDTGRADFTDLEIARASK